jgi:hypothetical protein
MAKIVRALESAEAGVPRFLGTQPGVVSVASREETMRRRMGSSSARATSTGRGARVARWLLCLGLAANGCAFIPEEMRPASAGRVMCADGTARIAHARVRTTPRSGPYCHEETATTFDTVSDEDGRFRVPRRGSLELFVMVPHGDTSYCQHYELPAHPDVRPIQADFAIAATKHSFGKSVRLSVREAEAPRGVSD